MKIDHLTSPIFVSLTIHDQNGEVIASADRIAAPLVDEIPAVKTIFNLGVTAAPLIKGTMDSCPRPAAKNGGGAKPSLREESRPKSGRCA